MTADRTFQARLKTPITIEQLQADAAIGTAMHQNGRNYDIAKTNHGTEMV